MAKLDYKETIIGWDEWNEDEKSSESFAQVNDESNLLEKLRVSAWGVASS